MKRAAALFVPGFIFAIGLGVSGMTDPTKVAGFLDVAGVWDPTLAFVMAGAVGAFAVLNVLVHRRTKPLLGGSFPGVRALDWPDRRAIVGAAIFGVGWGLAGLCPGPSVADLATLRVEILAFLAAMLAGMKLAQRAAGADS
jgi:hypothetical protein